MKEKKFLLDGWQFADEEEFNRARKEKETIAYIKANTNLQDSKKCLKLYNKINSGTSFHSIYGYEFLNWLRGSIVSSGLIKDDELPPVSLASFVDKNVGAKGTVTYKADWDKHIQKLEKQLEEDKSRLKIYKMAVAFLVFVIITMTVITCKTKYSVFTYFTDYEQKIREEVEDEYEQWKAELEEREKALSSENN